MIASPPSARSRPRPQGGFTLTELAVVFTIVAFLLASLLYTLSAQTEQRSRDTTTRRLDEAKELLLAFAIANQRLPCPAAAPARPPFNNAGGTGIESGGGAAACNDSYTGFLPGKTIGFQPVDDSGYALDAWGNPIRYAVSSANWSGTGRFTNSHSSTAWSLTQAPNDLVICAAWGASTSNCGGAASVTNQNVVVAVIWSQGKNFAINARGGVALSGSSNDELANNKHRLPSVQNNHPVFVWHGPTPADATSGEYDDLMTWIPVSLLYGRMVSAGVLP
jgi:type II secretory pathway pseudopilin PulG